MKYFIISQYMSEGDGVSLILIDRSLDLCTACTYNTESVLGRILCTLPHLNHQNNDVAVNMSPLCLGAEVMFTVNLFFGY